MSQSTPLSRSVLRLGLLAAGVAAAATAVPAEAAEITMDGARTTANHQHHVQFRDSFAIHQLGKVDTAAVRNQATATGAGCTADDACRSVALSFQIVTLAGQHVHLNAVNNGTAVNDHCTGCQTLAGAYQFVVSTPSPLRLSAATRARLAGVHHRLDALGRSRLPATQLKQQTDALAAEVTAILKDAVAAANHPPARAVTVHRHLEGWPGH